MAAGRRAPFVLVCIDGNDAVEVARSVHAFLDIPAVGRGITAPTLHVQFMREIQRVFEFVPAMVVCPTLVTYCYEYPSMVSEIAWDKIYPKDKTLFISLAENISADIETEGTHHLTPLYRSLMRREAGKATVSMELAKLGYRSKIISDIGSRMDIIGKVLAEIRLTQRNILEIEKERRAHDES